MSIAMMIEAIRFYGFDNAAVLKAMEKIDRKLFVPKDLEKEAYEDTALPIGYEQTISQPYTVAHMLDLLQVKNGMRILEVGAGSGWTAALLQFLVDPGEVYAIEYVKELAEMAKANVKKTKYVPQILQGDGSLGLTEKAPFDRIICSCACPEIPKPWFEQLKDDGLIVAPVGNMLQYMTRYTKSDDRYEKSGSFAFVPLKGKYEK